MPEFQVVSGVASSFTVLAQRREARPLDIRVIPGAIRSVTAVVAGMATITLTTELIEFALVALSSGGPVTDPELYYAVRNRSWFLGIKLVYNTGAAFLGGYVAAWIGRRRQVGLGATVAAVQVVAFGWALSQPEFRQTMPLWMWLALTFLTVPAVVSGAIVRSRPGRLAA